MNDIFSYDWKKIGERIKSERKKIGMSQSSFAKYCGLHETSRGTVGKWESGEQIPDLQAMLKMCELFKCELGYVLREKGYENKTREKTDIASILKLNVFAIDTLLSFARDNVEYMEFIEDLLSNPVDLYGLTVIYKEYKRVLSYEQLKSLGVEDDAVVIGQMGGTMLTIEADAKKDFILYRLQKPLIKFAEKNK